MLQYTNCKISWQQQSIGHIKKKIARVLHIKETDFLDFRITKKSLDARRKPDLVYLYTVVFAVSEEEQVLRRNRKNKNLSVAKESPSLWKRISQVRERENVIVVGAGPDVISRGFVYVRESENLMDDVKSVVRNEIRKCEQRGIRDWGTIKSVTRDTLRDYIFMKTKRNPMIIPIIQEV